MLKSTLLSILRTFSRQELNRLDDFLLSPYFNKKEGVIKLFNALKKFAPDYNADALQKERIWSVIFPGEKYNYGIMKNIIFDLQKLIVKFTGIESYGSDPVRINIAAADTYVSRGLADLTSKMIRETMKMVDSDDYGLENFHKKFLLARTEQTLQALEHDIRDLKETDSGLMNDDLANYYYSQFFFSNYNSLQISFLYNHAVKKENFEAVIASYLKFSNKHRITEMAYNSFMTVFQPFDENNYYQLKKLYYENFDKLSRLSKFYFNTALLNFCKNNSNSGKLFFIKERYQYVKLMMDEKLYGNESGSIDRYFLMNAVIAGCTAGEFEWSEEIVEKNKSLVKEDVRELFVNFAYTHINFKKKNFTKALYFLSKCTGAMGMDKINIKVYEFFLYYDLEYYEELKNLVDSGRHFINNDKNISEHSKKEFGNFVNSVNKLSDYRYDLKNIRADDFKLAELKKSIAEKTMSGKNWLNEKIAELEKIDR